VYFLGIDAGTSRIKAALIDGEGNQIDIASMPVKVLFPFEGACEINMMELWNTMCKITRSLSQRNLQIWNKLVGIGITGQGDGLWSVDSKGKPARNALLWNDTRTKNLKISNRDDIDKICIKNFANIVYAGSSPILLKWLKEKEKEDFKKISTILHCKDWLNFMLTGELVTDYSDASTALLNIFEKKYVDEILETMDLEKCKKLFPEAVPSTTIIGNVNKIASNQTGIKEGIPVIAGAVDVAAVALGAGIKQNGEACTIVGTTLCNEIVLDKKYVDFKNGMIICYIMPEKYMNLMPTLNGTSTIDWIKNIFYPDLTFKQLENRLLKVPLGSRGIIYHPYIYGERAPFKDSFACGGFYGLKSAHNKIDMVRAAYEGLVFSLYDCYQSLPQIYDMVYISGGGSKSKMLCQMISDCLGKKVVRPAVKELGIAGIVNTLKISLAYNNNFSRIQINDETTFIPDMEKHIQYMKFFDMFKDLRIKMEKFWKIRNSII
jgi:sugar (pentulose or hexulose) kinase